MSVRELAIKDIKNELKQESKCFLAFNTQLNPKIRNIVKSYINLQEELSNGKGNI